MVLWTKVRLWDRYVLNANPMMRYVVYEMWYCCVTLDTMAFAPSEGV